MREGAKDGGADGVERKTGLDMGGGGSGVISGKGRETFEGEDLRVEGDGGGRSIERRGQIFDYDTRGT